MKLIKRILNSTVALFVFGVILTVIISSSFYLLINYKFYYTGTEWQIKSEANIVSNAIEAYLTSNADKDVVVTRKYINSLISRDKSYIEVECLKGNESIWMEKNNKDKYLDGTRSIVSFETSINRNDLVYHIKINRGNRPKWYTQLGRAWTFSLADYLKDKNGYVKGKMDYRSWPLVFSIILSGLCVLSTLLFFRKIYLDGLRQLADIKNQLKSLNADRSQLVTDRNTMADSLDKLEFASKKLYNVNINLKNEIARLGYYETVTKSLEDENTQLKECHDKARLLYKNYKELSVKSEDDCEFLKMMEFEINKLKDELVNKDKEIENKDNAIINKEKEITKLQRNISLSSLNTDDTSSQKKIDKILKTVLPHVMFTKHSVKQIVKDAPVSDMVTLEIMSELLVALDSKHELVELYKRFSCEEMKDNKYGLYRLKKGTCRVYFYFIPSNSTASNGYKNMYVEVIDVLYIKKQNEISDYVKNARPSWLK
ncbi:MAG: hypothetical protein PHP95_04130 [Desulfuromonadaceae bacterium]|nr:hypothetical protein [Desulfuromonadaceae bacterium]MDD2847624.1 hypothetical protein [Desulfuromonadaceae bacterium]MDD4131130.1 hypothetical protein [Desulfuromonadaceae bacterium]